MRQTPALWSPMLPALLLALLLVQQARGADAHIGVHPGKGEFVLLRDVNARAAYRPAPPGIALIVDPKPNRELDHSLGIGEMSDDDFAAMSSGQLGQASVTPSQQMTDRALHGSLGRVTGDNGVLSGNLSGGIGGVTGAVTGATRGIAPTVTGALSQFPLGAGASAGKGP